MTGVYALTSGYLQSGGMLDTLVITLVAGVRS